MADSTKHVHPINGGTLISDLKSLFSLVRTKRTIAFAYGFVFAFVVFTVFLAFTPNSNSSSPWFSNIFSTTSTTSTTSSPSTPTTVFSDGSYRSNFPSIFSYFFPNSSSNPSKINPPRSHNTTVEWPIVGKPPPVPEDKTKIDDRHEQTNNSTLDPSKIDRPRSQNTTFESPNVDKQQPIVKNETKIVHPDDKIVEVSKSPSSKPVNQTTNSGPNPSFAQKNSSIAGKGGTGGQSSSTSALLVKKQSNSSSVSEKQRKSESESLVEGLMNCDIYDGGWVKDNSYPLYKPGSCSLIDEQFNCFVNGRPDSGYQKLKWKPKACTLPRLNGSHMLELLRGKRLVYVGDSLNRNMWESLVCILRNSVKDQSKVYEATGKHHFRTEASYSFIFKDYDCTIEFFVSPFLVQEWEIPSKNGNKKETLRLDLIGRSADKYKSADILIFNTGHWWTHDKTAKGQDYYQEGSHVYGELDVLEAFRRALTTWARWVDANVNSMKTHVLFRGYSASHFSGGQWNSGGQCDNETEPIKNVTYLTPYPPKMTVLEAVFKGMKTRISYLNVTRLTDFRKDGHPSIYRKQKIPEEERKSPLKFQDCSHWCLPGVPDAWNELLYAEILRRNQKKKS